MGLPPSVRIYFATGLVDMRNGVDGLRTIVEQVLRRNPNDGHLFVFVGKRVHSMKVLTWDGTGMIHKKLDAGRFELPARGPNAHCARRYRVRRRVGCGSLGVTDNASIVRAEPGLTTSRSMPM